MRVKDSLPYPLVGNGYELRNVTKFILSDVPKVFGIGPRRRGLSADLVRDKDKTEPRKPHSGGRTARAYIYRTPGWRGWLLLERTIEVLPYNQYSIGPGSELILFNARSNISGFVEGVNAAIRKYPKLLD